MINPTKENVVNPMDDEHSLSAQSQAPPPKRRHLPPTRDRLSELPDFILGHILSYLFIHEAARTSILSKRFASLWNSIPAVKFSDVNSKKYDEAFVAFVNTALSLHHGFQIDEFSLTFRYDLHHMVSVNEWINFALQKKVKRLSLNFTPKSSGNRISILEIVHSLPNFLYNNDKLIELVTCRCKFSSDALINWSSLRKLSITRTKLNKKLISRVLRGCPALETLELKEWSGFNKVRIKSVSLKVLRIIEEQCPSHMIRPQDFSLLEVSGPNLVELELSGSLYRTGFRLSNVGRLINAKMDFEVKPQPLDQDIVREVLGSLCFVKSLAVGGWCIKALSSCEAYNLSSPRSERRNLIMCIPLIKWNHLGIASLLQSSPNLETLAIKLSHCSDMCALVHGSSNSCDKEYYWKSWSTISKCPLLHLKKVKVIGFRDTCSSMKPLFQFLEFLLRNSSVLEEIVIQASKYVTQSIINDALKLLDIPTASPDVVVQFEPSHLWVDTLCMYQKSDPLWFTST